jgi:hypothetical protein
MPNACRNQQQQLSAVSIFAAQQPIGCGQLGRLQDGWSATGGMKVVVDGTRMVSSLLIVDRLRLHARTRSKSLLLALMARAPPSDRTASMPFVMLLALTT